MICSKFDFTGGRIWTCSDIVCVNNFTCASDEVYPYCACEREYSGYNCAIKSTIPDPGTEDMGTYHKKNA